MGSVPERDSQAVVRRRRPLLSCRLVRSSAVHRSGWLIAGAIGAFAFAVSADAVTRIGTSGPDVLRGSRSADELYGRAGSDRLLGLSGRDILDGGAGPDVVVGGADSDLLIGGSGHDLLRARDGDGDRLRCGQGRDTAIVDSVDAVGGCEVIRRPAPPAPEAPPPARTQPPPSPIALENQKPGHAGGRRSEEARPARSRPHPSAPLPASRSPSMSRPIRARPIGFSSSESVGTGVSARLVACLPSCNGSASARPEPSPSPNEVGLVHAGWPVAQRLEIPSDWVSGYYLVHYVLGSGEHGDLQRKLLRAPRSPEWAPGSHARPGRSQHVAGLQRLGRRQPLRVQQPRRTTGARLPSTAR